MAQSYKKAMDDEGSIKSTLLSTDRHPADDLSILAAMCLIKLSISTDSRSYTLSSAGIGYWLRATMLLEHAWTNSPSNFQISLLLVKLYAYMGCGSLAMRAYQRLNIKQIQHNTLSHIIFSQISTLHPHPFTHQPDNATPLRSPLDHCKDQLDFYGYAPNQINKNIWRAFQLGSYNSIVELTEFDEKLDKSLGKIMSVVESGRMFRLTNPNTPLPYGYSVLCRCTFFSEL